MIAHCLEGVAEGLVGSVGGLLGLLEVVEEEVVVEGELLAEVDEVLLLELSVVEPLLHVGDVGADALGPELDHLGHLLVLHKQSSTLRR